MALIQSPISFNLLKMFRTPRNQDNSIDQLNRTIQPIVNSTLLSIMDAPQGSDFINPLVLGPNNAFTASQLVAAYDISFRSTAALGAGVTMRATPYIIRTNAPGLSASSSLAPLAAPQSFTTGEWALWGALFPSNAPLIMMPGDIVGIWLNSLAGASPNITQNITLQQLTS